MGNTNEAANVDRKKLGLAQFFSEIHPLLSPMNDMNAEETVELLCMQSRRIRKKFADKVNESVSSILKDRTIDVDDYTRACEVSHRSLHNFPSHPRF